MAHAFAHADIPVGVIGIPYCGKTGRQHQKITEGRMSVLLLYNR